jgi:hypothetical protein
MSTSTTSSPDPRRLPTARDLDRLACAVRTTAQDRDLPERVVDWYEDWIFLFVGWCLKAPPHCVHRDRINDFWWALTDHPGMRRWKVCQAMDALSMLFGTLGGTDVLAFPGGTSSTEAGGEAPDDGPEQPSRYLPDGRLPEDVDPREEVPTREDRPVSSAEPGASPTDEPEPAPSNDASSREERESPRTLFNPTGAAPPSADSPPEAQSEEATEASDTEQTENLVSVEVPRAAAERLRAAAQALELPAPLLVARAIDLLRDELDEVRGEDDDTGPLRRYQAQVHLLHRHGTADLPSLDANDRDEKPGASPQASRGRQADSAVCIGAGRGDGWTGQVPVLEIRSD